MHSELFIHLRSSAFICGSISPSHILLAGLIFFASHLVSTTTGFGNNVLGLPLLALVVGMEPGKQALVVLGMVLYAYLTARWYRKVDVRQVMYIGLVAGAGLVVGMMITAKLDRRLGTALLAVFVTLVGLRGLFGIAAKVRSPMWAAKALLFLGGLVHGAFTTGGPLLVVYCHRALPHKSVFRATLGIVWLLLGLGLLIGWTVGHSWDPATPHLCLIGLPFMVGGLAAGEYLHHRVDEKNFRRGVNLTLVATGLLLLVSAIR